MNDSMTDQPDPDPGGTPTVLVSNRQALPVDEPSLRSLARETMLAEGLRAAELSVSFVDEREIEELHVRYLDEPGPTDVLSFPLEEDGADERGDRVLGDVVIAPSVAARNNPTDPDGEVRLLLVHGILHLLGYDHEERADKTEMWARMERYSGVRAP
jgi:probable rRNA maturation factor